MLAAAAEYEPAWHDPHEYVPAWHWPHWPATQEVQPVVVGLHVVHPTLVAPTVE